MNDEAIIELFWARDERAVSELKAKYGGFCRSVAMRVSDSREDAEEVENDAYLDMWNTIPPNRPVSLKAYLGAICRRIAVDMVRNRTRVKRGRQEYLLSLDELSECVPAEGNGDFTDKIALRDALNSFLGSLPENKRDLFMKRYFWLCSVKELAAETGMSESNVKITLMRTREALREHFLKEGIDI